MVAQWPQKDGLENVIENDRLPPLPYCVTMEIIITVGVFMRTISRDLVGQKINHLTLLERGGGFKRKGRPNTLDPTWIVQCICGVEFETLQSGLMRGKQGGKKKPEPQSCGCLTISIAIAKNTTHGLTKTPLYTAWRNMKSRCSNPRLPNYSNYGGRGIKVCARWLNSFESFKEDMGEGYKPSLSIDRKNNNGNYTKRNCRWVDLETQNMNKNTTLPKVRTPRGMMHIKDAAKEFGFEYATLKNVFHSRGAKAVYSLLKN